MKKRYNFSILKNAMLVMFTTLVFTLQAQTGHFQIVHNAASVNLDTVDVYLNSTKVKDNMAFRSATAMTLKATGTYLLSINNRNSTDSANQVIAQFNVTISSGIDNILMLTGVDSVNNYAANPNGRSTALKLTKLQVSYFTSLPTTTTLSFAHGVTDEGATSVKLRSFSNLGSSVKFGDSAFVQAFAPYNSLTANAVATMFDIYDSNNVIQNSYLVPLNNYGMSSLFLFSSGFSNTVANQNGQSKGVFYVDPNGGAATQLTSSTSFQVFNNVADTSVDSIDVWFNNTKLITSLAKGKASTVNLPVGTYNITVSKRNSADSSSANAFAKMNAFPALVTQLYTAFVSGVKDTNAYATSPDGLNRKISIVGNNNYRILAQNSLQVDLAFYNGSIDAPTFDVNRITPTGLKLANDMKYGDASFNYVSQFSGKYVITLTSKDSSKLYYAFLLDLTGKTGQAGILYTTGLFNAFGNTASMQPMGLNILYANGTIQQLKSLNASVQFVNNCADQNFDSIDVYVNGTRTLKGMGFRTATPFINMTPFAASTIAVAPKNSASIASAFYTTTITFDTGSTNYLVFAGLQTDVTPSHKNNPYGISTTFKAYLNKAARTTSFLSKNADLLYFQGATDLMRTTMLGYSGAMFISKNDSFGRYRSIYSYNPALDDLEFDLTDADNDTIIIKEYSKSLISYPVANISKRNGQAGLLFTSGFYSTIKHRDTIAVSLDSAKRANGLTAAEKRGLLGMYIAWPDGKIDTIQVMHITTGIDELYANNTFNANFYPNPANDLLNINFELKATSNVKAELYDINGRLVQTQSLQNMQSGKSQIQIDLRNTLNGLYFCSLEINGQKLVRKISVIK